MIKYESRVIKKYDWTFKRFYERHTHKNPMPVKYYKQEKEQSEIADPQKDLFVVFVQFCVVYFVWCLCLGVLCN